MAKQKEYSDFNLSMIPHPVTGDVPPLKGFEAVKKALKNLILTAAGERPFSHKFGTNIRALLFEPLDPITALQLQSEIEDAIARHEPRVQMVFVKVYPDVDNNRFSVEIRFSVKGTPEPVTFDFFLTRVR